jgi:hypothetical protein
MRRWGSTYVLYPKAISTQTSSERDIPVVASIINSRPREWGDKKWGVSNELGGDY